MLSKERAFHANDRILQEGGTTTSLMILVQGSVDIAYDLEAGGEVIVDSLVGGELLGLSALLEPFESTANAIAREDGTLIEIDAQGLRKLCDSDPTVGYTLLLKIVEALRSRLTATRIQLAGQG